ncbi:MAG: carboxypeptidase-like regulatory domain-containing protein, partial [Chitinophagaceae bacterium]
MKRSMRSFILKFDTIIGCQTKAKTFLTLAFIFCLALNSIAQSRIITGLITDENGTPVEGATVRVKGSKSGTAADINGAYTISVPAGATLVVSGVGVILKEVAVRN